MKRHAFLAAAALAALASRTSAIETHIGFLWHMHQPIYYPGESIIQTDANNRFSFSVTDVHNQRFGPYTTWPRDAVQAGLGMQHLGASVSFSGSLMQNLNDLRNAGVNGGMWNNWQGAYQQSRSWNTSQGNTRMDLVGFSYHHALMPLLDQRDMRMQIRMHKTMTQQTFGSSVPYSQGFFPAETAFSERMIPALLSEGFDWALVDNIHFDRATKNYPHTNASGLFAPNKADQINPDPTTTGGAWIQLNNLWAPSRVSAPFSYRPHNVQYVDPNTGTTSRIVAVPGARYEGNEDGRGGFGALQYESVMNQYSQYNTDPAHPLLVVLHHDGDNYGGGSDSYYHNNFQSMVNWAQANPNYDVTTIRDYLQRFPVASNDVIHVENGSWAGADGGDAEFKKWLGDPNGSGWSPDRNSWAVMTAAKNRVYTAEDLTSPANTTNVINNSGTAAEKAWHNLTQAQASDHWYWDGTEVWDSNVTRGCNLAVQQANVVLNAFPGPETTPPSVFVPQRDSYNPGEFEFSTTRESSDFKVWTYAYDVSGLQSVTLKFRLDADGENPIASTQNETYAGGAEVGAWQSLSMASSDVFPPGNILAAQYRALQYQAMITGQTNKLIDYYVEAVDQNGNITRTDIQHVWVGQGSGGGTQSGQFNLDGVLDASAREVAANNGMTLHVTMRGGKLYVATNDAGEGNDHFIYLADAPGPMVAANWAKAGQIAHWDAYLADENNNDWEGWFDAQGATAAATGANGGVLEGTLDLAGEFGAIPPELYLAVGLYQTADGGALLSTHQVPGSLDGDGNLQANEYYRYVLPQGWMETGTGSWNVAWNWAEGVPNSVGAHARFLNNVTAPTSVSTDTPVTAGQMTFSSAFAYTLSGGGTINLDSSSGSATINVNLGTHTIQNPVRFVDNTTISAMAGTRLNLVGAVNIADATVTTTGPGTIALSGVVAASGNATVRVNGGNFVTTTDLFAVAVQIDAGTAHLDSNQHLKSLSVNMGAKAVLTDIAGGRYIRTEALGSLAGQLELADNGLIVDYTTTSPIGTIASAIATGFNGGAWNGTRIVSALAGISANPTTAIGYAEASALSSVPALFAGETYDPSTVLVLYTIAGDTNLDRVVNGADFNALASNFGMSDRRWTDGDLNYDTVVNGSDFNLLASNFGMSISTNMPGATVPEPACSAATFLLMSVLGRRRRGAQTTAKS